MTADQEVLKKHYVTFYSPGTMVAEQTIREVGSWDIETAVKMASEIVERHGAIPYCFQFWTKERGHQDFEPKRTATSPLYYLPHCRVETLEEVEARNDPKEKILRENMRCNGWDRIVVTTKGWQWTQPLRPDDVVLS